MSPESNHRRKGVFGRLSKRQRIASATAGAVIVLGAAGGITAALSGGHPAARAHEAPTTITSTTTSPTRPKARLARHLCPLTGMPAPGGRVPQRPALGVKIGNDPASRPQTGLEHADIVYEEMAEGGITRYLAVFQCHEAPVLGPVRSVRWTDWQVLASYRHPILAFSGGINYWYKVVASLHWLFDANGSFPPGTYAYYRTSNRVPPWNLYTSTARLWALDKVKTPPPPQFLYEKRLQAGFTRVASVALPGFAGGSTVVWRWDQKTGAFERYYGSQPDLDSSGVQLQAKNVIVEMVRTRPGPYAESGTVHGTDSITVGSGVAYVFRQGHFVKCRWRRRLRRYPFALYLPKGRRVYLTPGNTWVEMVPTSYSVQISR